MNPMYLLVAVPIFALLILVHEFGHFLTAKWAGIRVDEFGIGFPPRLVGVKRGETIYSINLLPIGGFVKMPGENGETTDANGVVDPRAFASKSPGKRAIVLLAGVTMNLLLAIVLFTAAEAVGPVQYLSYVRSVQAGSPAQAAGMQSGDHILSVNGNPITYFSDLMTQVNTAVDKAPSGGQTVPVVLVVQHANASQPVSITVQARIHITKDQGHLGLEADPAHAVHQSTPLWQAPAKGVQDIGFVAVATWQGIHDVVRGLIPVNQAFEGPVGIVTTTGHSRCRLVPAALLRRLPQLQPGGRQRAAHPRAGRRAAAVRGHRGAAPRQAHQPGARGPGEPHRPGGAALAHRASHHQRHRQHRQRPLSAALGAR
jgi:regulator of sigma E protease